MLFDQIYHEKFERFRRLAFDMKLIVLHVDDLALAVALRIISSRSPIA
jgi:hypothetical protein